MSIQISGPVIPPDGSVTAVKIGSGAAPDGQVLTADGAGGAGWEAAASVPSASETVAGSVELATTAEAAAGTDTTRAVTPEGLPLRVIGGGWALGSGGNSRGADAVDLQTVRSDPTQVAAGNHATVGGGKNNTASGVYATVGGGQNNTASGTQATVGGGYNNTSGVDATVGGGYSNFANGSYATVGGGKGNAASGTQATVGGGGSNGASGTQATVGGGYGNGASGTQATVGGGGSNGASGTQATVGGGGSNGASEINATVGGGKFNTASGPYAMVGGGYGNTASGTHATVGGGKNNTAGGTYAMVGGGIKAFADKYGQNAHASGMFSADGDAQTSVLVARLITSVATPAPLFLDGASAKCTIATDTTWAFNIMVVARRTDADGESAAYQCLGCIDNNAGTTALVGTVTKTVIAEDTAAWDCNVTADDANNALIVTVTGEAGKTIRWVARIELAEVTG